MQRLHAIDPNEATGKAKGLMESVHAQLGMTPNIVRTMANSPAALRAYLDFNAALAGGALPTRLREKIALVVAEVNRCDYCLAAHAALGKLVGLTEETIADSRRADSWDAREAMVLRFAHKVVRERGRVEDDDLAELRRTGYGDGEIVEIVANVALNLFTNYFNHVAGTEVDFPKVMDPAPAPNSRL